MTEKSGARGYSWPPFEPGNQVAVTHGAYSGPALAAKAAEVHEAILDVAPWLAEAHFLPAVARYLQAAAREQLLHDLIVKVSAEAGPGAVPSRTWEQATAAARLAAQLGSALGLDPTGHARLRAIAGTAEVTAMTLADLQTSGRAARLAAEERLAVEATATGSAPQRPQEPTQPVEATPPSPESADGHEDDRP